MVDISLAAGFWESLERLPAGERAAVQRALTQLGRKQEGAERLLAGGERFDDPALRLLRATPDTAVVLAGAEPRLLVALHAAPLEAARAWARAHALTVTAQGVLHVAPRNAPLPTPPPESPPEAAVPDTAPAALAGLDDEALAALGVPPGWEELVRGVADGAALRAAPFFADLPPYARDNLLALLAGDDLSAVLARQALHPPPERPGGRGGAPVEPTVLRAALTHPAGREAFSPPFGAEELEQALRGPLEKWRVFLHPDQARTVTGDYPGPALVLGGPGTGKTVVALHRARHLARAVFTGPEERIVLTTYSRTLAHALAEQRDILCGAEGRRIRVTTLHGWLRGLLREAGQAPAIAAGAQQDALWREAVAADPLGLGESFYRTEWERVVLAQDLRSEEDYLRAPRTGMPAIPTGREGRRTVWRVLTAYTEGLATRGLVDFDLLVRAARERLVAGTLPVEAVRAVVVDEAQDLRSEELRFLAALMGGRPNGLFLVGDAHQRIFRSPFGLARYGIEAGERTARLRLNYRSTGHILVRALQVVAHEPVADLDEQVHSFAGYYSLRTGQPPVLARYADPAAEAEGVCRLLQGLAPELPSWNQVAIFARLERQVRALRDRLQAAGIPSLSLRDDTRPSGPGVHLGTMHRAKGLEYPVVILVGLNRDVLPLPLAGRASVRQQAEHRQRERNLLYVAMSRARDRLYLSSTGASSRLLEEVFAPPR